MTLRERISAHMVRMISSVSRASRGAAYYSPARASCCKYPADSVLVYRESRRYLMSFKKSRVVCRMFPRNSLVCRRIPLRCKFIVSLSRGCVHMIRRLHHGICFIHHASYHPTLLLSGSGKPSASND